MKGKYPSIFGILAILMVVASLLPGNVLGPASARADGENNAHAIMGGPSLAFDVKGATQVFCLPTDNFTKCDWYGAGTVDPTVIEPTPDPGVKIMGNAQGGTWDWEEGVSQAPKLQSRIGILTRNQER